MDSGFPNQEALNQALNIYRAEMRKYLIRTLRQVPGRRVEELLRSSLNQNRRSEFARAIEGGTDLEGAIDIGDFPHIVQRNWDAAFSPEWGYDKSLQSRVFMIRDSRNQDYHPGLEDLDSEDVRSNLTIIAQVLNQINAQDARKNVEAIRGRLAAQPELAGEPEIATPTDQEQVPTPPQEPEKSDPKPRPRSRSSLNLKPWWQVIEPHPDVTDGSFSQSEFAADLEQVITGKASREYGNPAEFFSRTYITPGIHTLLVNAIKRINGQGGDPVIQTKTGFGGGKTHSLIALYHLASSPNALANDPEVQRLFTGANIDPRQHANAKVAVIIGSYHSAATTRTTDNGGPLNTLWGEMAYQLGGQEAYDLVNVSGKQAIAPVGEQLDALFASVGPAVILIDELVAHVRNVPRENVGPIYTFLQALTESATRSKNVTIVVTLPEHSEEAGGDAGMEALTRLEHLFGRSQAIWQPLEVNEAFEVVRRRLFANNVDEEERDRTCEAFSKLYGGTLKRHFPREATEIRYAQRIKDCFPIHPEIFDRLYNDWSPIYAFQRTRGVLRIMANVINRLYRDKQYAPLILPASLPLNDQALANEFDRVLDGRWDLVVAEIDGPNARTAVIDDSQKQFGDVGGAARRVARGIFLGSPPTGAFRGIDYRQTMLASVEPGQSVGAYRDALDRMHGQLYFLYQADAGRQFFHTQENLNKVAADREVQISNDAIDDYIIARLRDASGRGIGTRRSDVVVCPESSADVQDVDFVRLVILQPSKYAPSRSTDTDYAYSAALNILNKRGENGRTMPNSLLFLVSKYNEINSLRNLTRKYLAWDSIIQGERKLDLDGARFAEASRNANSADQSVINLLPAAYKWVLAPYQTEEQRADEFEFTLLQTDASGTGDIVEKAFEICVDEEALVDQIDPTELQAMLERHVWDNDNYGDHISVDVLWQLMTSHAYMHRLRNKTVLNAAIARGATQRIFGHATGYRDGTYNELRFGDAPTHLLGELAGLIVRHEMAELVEEEKEKARTAGSDDPQPTPPPDTEDYDGDEEPHQEQPSPPRPKTTDITVSKKIENDLSVDLNVYREELLRTLRTGGGDVAIEITIIAHNPDGFSENITRSVRQNSEQLGFDIQIPEN